MKSTAYRLLSTVYCLLLPMSLSKLILIQFYVLLAGVLFAWGNFGYELYNYLHDLACATGCAVGIVNPIYTPCFYGAITFTIAFTLSVLLMRRRS